jgi:secreted trypsin-like serine protease
MNLFEFFFFFSGDSGSSVVITSPIDGRYYLVGVTSLGLACGSTFPSIYTRISSHIGWIENIVWPQ